MLDAYVPVTSLLVMFVLGLCGYICFLVGYRRALADFPAEDVERDEVAQLELRQTSTQERLTALEERADESLSATIRKGLFVGSLERLDKLEERYLWSLERLDKLEDWQDSLGSYWERLAATEKDIEHAATIRKGLLNTGLTHTERLDELESWKASLGNLSHIFKTSLPKFDDLVERVEELERQT